MSTYLITGIAGFIGSSLARAVLQRRDRVRGIDNFSTGKPENITEIIDQIDFREADLLDLEATQQACRDVDYVLHEAAIPSVPRSINKPLKTNRANVDWTLNLLIAARDAKVGRVIYAASSSAYGDAPTLPKREDMAPNPISPYAVSKLAGEYYMTSFWRCYGLETVCLRYFNVFGPRQDPHSPYSGVLAKFITQMLAGEQPVIFGDGKHSRDFTYIENVVQANLFACTAPVKDVVGRVQVVQYRQRAANRTERNVLGLAETHGIFCSGEIWTGEARRCETFAGRSVMGRKIPGIPADSKFRRRLATNRRVVSNCGSREPGTDRQRLVRFVVFVCDRGRGD